MAFERATAYLARNFPKLKETSELLLVPDGELTFRWEGIPPDIIDEVKQFLALYGDVSNNGAVAPTKLIAQIQTQNGTRVGPFRATKLVSLRSIQDPRTYDQNTVEQTVRFGYLTATDAQDWPFARIESLLYSNTNSTALSGVTNAATQNPLLKYIISFPNIGPDYLEAMKNCLTGASVTGPTVQDALGTQVQLPGTWKVNELSSKKEEDGSHTLLLEMSQQIFVLSEYEHAGASGEEQVWRVYNCPLDVAQQIMTDFNTQYGPGVTCQSGRLPGDKIVHLILSKKTADNTAWQYADILAAQDCAIKEYEWIYMAVSNPTSYPCPTTQTKGTRYERTQRDNGNGTFDVFIKAFVAQYQTLTYKSEENADIDGTTVIQKALDPSSLTPISYTQGTLKYRRVELRNDCLVNVTDDSKLTINQTRESYTARQDRTIDEVLNTESANPISVPPSPTDGQVIRVENTPTPSGNTKTKLETENELNQIRTQKEASLSKLVERTTNTSVSTPLADPSPTKGIIQRVTNKPTLAYNRYETEAETITPQNQTRFHVEQRADRTITTQVDTELPDPIDTNGTPADGTTVQISNVATEAGQTHGTKSVELVQDQTRTANEVSLAQSSSTTIHTSSPTQASVPSPSAGIIVRVRNTPKPEYYRYETEVETITINDESLVAYQAISTPKYSGTREIFAAAASQPTFDPTTQYGELNVRMKNGRYYGERRILTYLEEANIGSTVNETDEASPNQEPHFKSDGSLAFVINFIQHQQFFRDAGQANLATSGGWRTEVRQASGGWWRARWRTGYSTS